MESCRDAGGSPLGAGAWSLATFQANDGLAATDSCAKGGSLELDLSPASATLARGVYSFDAPPNTAIAGYELARSLETAPSSQLPLYRYAAFVRERIAAGNSNDYGCASFGWGCTSSGDPLDPSAADNIEQLHAPSLQAVELWVGCIWLVCDAPEERAARLRLFRSRVTLSDDAPPIVTATSGSLLSAPASGVATLRVGAEDLGGGVASAEASLDGGKPLSWSAGDSFVNCRPPYTAARPCPLETEASFAFDTNAFSNGAHVLTGSVTDAAGNSTDFGPFDITVDNPAIVTQLGGNGTPAVTTPRLQLAASPAVRRRGTAATVRGSLLTQAGAPISGARLTVHSLQLATTTVAEKQLPDVYSNSGGEFSVPVSGDGAQLLRIEFAPSAGAAGTASAGVVVRTATELSAAASKSRLRRGQTLTFRGKLLGAGPSASGATVSIQAIVRRKWRPVGSATVRADGSYKWTYKFAQLNRVTIFSFRTVVVKTPGWPWPTTASKRLRVKVRP